LIQITLQPNIRTMKSKSFRSGGHVLKNGKNMQHKHNFDIFRSNSLWQSKKKLGGKMVRIREW